MVILGTKWPSMTSTWIQSAPAASTARTSSPSLAKSAASIEGATRSGRCIDSLLQSAVRLTRCSRLSKLSCRTHIGRGKTFRAVPGIAQKKDIMARTDAIVLGAGIVGTSTALQLARRGLGVALVDRRGAGAETPHRNAGLLPSNTVFPPPVPPRPSRPRRPDGEGGSEPELAPVFGHAVHWQDAASVSNPLAVTKAYAARLTKLGGVILTGNARSLHRADGGWRIETAEGPLDAPAVVLALGPVAPDLLAPLGIRLPLGIKRGYHLHFRAKGNAALTRPVVDIENGYCLAPMEQGIRLTTGAEFAARAAPPPPVQ